MYGQAVGDGVLGDVRGYLAVAVACYVLQGGVTLGTLVETLQRHDGEDLSHTPRIGQRLEEREVAEIFVCQQFVYLVQLLGHTFHLRGYAVYLARDRPVEFLDLGAGPEVDDAVREELERLVAYLLCVVPVLEGAALRQVVPYLVQVLDELVVIGAYLPLLGHLGQRGCLEHLYYQHRVVCGERAAALGDDVGVRQAVLVGRVDYLVHDVVDILLHRVVDAALAAGRAGAVVVDAKAAARIDEVDRKSHLVQLYVELRRLAYGCLDVAYVGDLTADVEVYELQTVGQTYLFELVEGLEQFARREAELAGVAAAVLPLAAARGAELDAYADLGSYVQALRYLGYEVQLVHLLDDEIYALAHLLCEQCQLDVAPCIRCRL